MSIGQPPLSTAQVSRPAAGRTGSSVKSGASGGRRSGPIRVLCVEDHQLVVDGLRAQFAISGDIEVVGHLPTAATLVAEVERLRPDVVLLDIEMPGPDVFETADRVRSEFGNVRLLVLSAHARESFVTAAFNSGACGYFVKSDDVLELIHCIREVVASPPGSFVLCSSLRKQLSVPTPASAMRDVHGRPGEYADAGEGRKAMRSREVSTGLGSLSPREFMVLRLIGKGYSRTDIAAQLSRSVKTIDGHQDRIMRKLGLKTRAELMRLAIREGLAQA
ncbi:MAG: response regulator transcription factor [Planctomycetaceae bacterium]|jgi:two-component system response regulator NreC|nr:response regulator transcription factor [Phycisphaerales bacterium]MCE2653545.1 response regulator transcription factor [Planctomycetaceae bacterium]